jgi:hypothetical protein
MIPEIKDTQDWYTVDTMMKNLVRQIPGFYHDYYRLSKNIELKIKELGLIDIELRKRYSIFYKEKRTEKLREINDAIRMFSKMHLLASLSKR